MTKKYLAIFLAAVIVAVSFSSCTGGGKDIVKKKVETTVHASVDTSSFRLSYSQSDSLDPFKTETLNNQVVQDLVYDSLFTLDENYEALPSVAESYSYPTPEKLSVKIKSNVKFSDGTVCTSENIEYSFKAAKDSPHWKNTLAGIKSITVETADTVTFKLKNANPDAHKLLTFAIAKAKEDKSGFKAGTGRYKFAKADGGVVLVKNLNYPNFKPRFTKINLVNITSGESIENAINIGNISYAFRDLSDGSKTKITAAQKNVNLNNLVFLGIYSKAGITQNSKIRQAINLAVDRDTLVKSAYRGYATASKSIYNPATKLAKQTELFATTANIAAAKQAIASSGYDKDKLKILLVSDNSEGKAATARLVKQQLEAVGFTVNLKIDKKASYRERVANGNFDIYVGETKLSGDMNLNGFFKEGGNLSYGIELDSKSAKAYRSYLNGKSEIGKFILAFGEEMPFVPLLYRKGMICYTKSLQGDMQGYEGNYFSNIQDWYYN